VIPSQQHPFSANASDDAIFVFVIVCGASETPFDLDWTFVHLVGEMGSFPVDEGDNNQLFLGTGS
jgi:hypothetical protein